MKTRIFCLSFAFLTLFAFSATAAEVDTPVAEATEAQLPAMEAAPAGVPDGAQDIENPGTICPADLDLTQGSLNLSQERQEATSCIFACSLFRQTCNNICGFGNVAHYSCLRFGGPVDCQCVGGGGFFVEC